MIDIASYDIPVPSERKDPVVSSAECLINSGRLSLETIARIAADLGVDVCAFLLKDGQEVVTAPAAPSRD